MFRSPMFRSPMFRSPMFRSPFKVFETRFASPLKFLGVPPCGTVLSSLAVVEFFIVGLHRCQFNINLITQINNKRNFVVGKL